MTDLHRLLQRNLCYVGNGTDGAEERGPCRFKGKAVKCDTHAQSGPKSRHMRG